MKIKVIPCRFCGSVEHVRKHGSGKSTKMQRYYCTDCVKTFQVKYIYNVSQPEVSLTQEIAPKKHSTQATPQPQRYAEMAGA